MHLGIERTEIQQRPQGPGARRPDVLRGGSRRTQAIALEANGAGSDESREQIRGRDADAGGSRSQLPLRLTDVGASLEQIHRNAWIDRGRHCRDHGRLREFTPELLRVFTKQRRNRVLRGVDLCLDRRDLGFESRKLASGQRYVEFVRDATLISYAHDSE